MDVNDLRIAVTVISLIAFVGLMAWVWRDRHVQAFDEAARLPLADDSRVPAP